MLQRSLERFLVHWDDDDSVLGKHQWREDDKQQHEREGDEQRIDSQTSGTSGTDANDSDNLSVQSMRSSSTSAKVQSSRFVMKHRLPQTSSSTPSLSQTQTFDRSLLTYDEMFSRGRQWSFAPLQKALTTAILPRLSLTQSTLSAKQWQQLQCSLVLNELSKLLLHSPDVLFEYERQKRLHLPTTLDSLLHLVINAFQRTAAMKHFLPFHSHLVTIVNRLMSLPHIGQLLQQIMRWERTLENILKNEFFEGHFRQEWMSHLIGILLPFKQLKRKEDFLCKWFSKLRLLLRAHRPILSESEKISIFKPSSISTSSAVSSASSSNLTTQSTSYGTFLLSLVKLFNCNATRAMRNGVSDVNKHLLTRLIPQLSQSQSQSQSTSYGRQGRSSKQSLGTSSSKVSFSLAESVDAATRSMEFMHEANCFAIFHRQLRFAAIQEIELLFRFHRQRHWLRKSIVYFEERQDKKVLTIDTLCRDLQYMQESGTTTKESSSASISSKSPLTRQSSSLSTNTAMRGTTKPSITSQANNGPPLIETMHRLLSGQCNDFKPLGSSARQNHSIFAALYSMFVSDVMKHPSNVVINLMLLDLVYKGALSWTQLAPKVKSSTSPARPRMTRKNSSNQSLGKLSTASVTTTSRTNTSSAVHEPAGMDTWLWNTSSSIMRVQSKVLNQLFNHITPLPYHYDDFALPRHSGLHKSAGQSPDQFIDEDMERRRSSIDDDHDVIDSSQWGKGSSSVGPSRRQSAQFSSSSKQGFKDSLRPNNGDSPLPPVVGTRSGGGGDSGNADDNDENGHDNNYDDNDITAEEDPQLRWQHIAQLVEKEHRIVIRWLQSEGMLPESSVETVPAESTTEEVPSIDMTEFQQAIHSLVRRWLDISLSSVRIVT